VLIPVSDLAQAKARLSPVLSSLQRRQLAEATLQTVVAAAAGACLEPIVLSRSDEVMAALQQARLLLEGPGCRGLNEALESALADLVAESAGEPRSLMIVHADLPLATPASFERLARLMSDGASVLLVRSKDGGTNVMGLELPVRFRLAYGQRSFASHAWLAASEGLSVHAADVPALALDLDVPEDLESLMAHPEGPGTAAGRLLERWRSSAL
jgi:2-phospho-L-lactate guanylyltransferase